MKWTQDDTLKFVELYRDHECLWNMNKATYRNKNLRLKAIQNIMEAMGQEGFGVAEIKQKIKNIRSTYNQEVQKIKKRATLVTCADDAYKPAVKWFTVMDQIMKGVRMPSETPGHVDPQADTENKQAVDQEGTADDHEIMADEQQPMQQPCSTHTPKDGKPRRNKRRLDDLSQATNELRTVNQLPSLPEASMQENEAFGRYVTSALNKLPERELIMAQNDIQNILTRYRLNMIPTPSPSDYVSYTPHKETP